MRAFLRYLVVIVVIAFMAAGLTWLAGPGPDIVNGRKSYEKLRIGMSEAEASSVLGKPPWHKSKLYATWFEDMHWYATEEYDDQDDSSPEPDSRLCDWYVWTYGTRSAWAMETLQIGVLFDKGKVICFWYHEDRENAAERGLKQLARRLSVNPSMLEHAVDARTCTWRNVS
jgi:hypothetical protein